MQIISGPLLRIALSLSLYYSKLRKLYLQGPAMGMHLLYRHASKAQNHQGLPGKSWQYLFGWPNHSKDKKPKLHMCCTHAHDIFLSARRSTRHIMSRPAKAENRGARRKFPVSAELWQTDCLKSSGEHWLSSCLNHSEIRSRDRFSGGSPSFEAMFLCTSHFRKREREREREREMEEKKERRIVKNLNLQAMKM